MLNYSKAVHVGKLLGVAQLLKICEENAGKMSGAIEGKNVCQQRLQAFVCSQYVQVLDVAVFPKKIQWLLPNFVEESQEGQSVPVGAGRCCVEPDEGW